MPQSPGPHRVESEPNYWQKEESVISELAKLHAKILCGGFGVILFGETRLGHARRPPSPHPHRAQANIIIQIARLCAGKQWKFCSSVSCSFRWIRAKGENDFLLAKARAAPTQTCARKRLSEHLAAELNAIRTYYGDNNIVGISESEHS